MRHIPTIFNDIYDELLLALDDSIPMVGEGTWEACGKSLRRVHEEDSVDQSTHLTNDATCVLPH